MRAVWSELSGDIVKNFLEKHDDVEPLIDLTLAGMLTDEEFVGTENATAPLVRSRMKPAAAEYLNLVKMTAPIRFLQKSELSYSQRTLTMNIQIMNSSR